MSGERPNQSAFGASVLLVGLSAEVAARVTEIVAANGVDARVTSIAKIREDTAKFRPFVVLVDAHLYDLDPQGFEKLARTAGAKLGLVNNVKDAENLVTRMLHAASSAASSAASRPPNKSTPPVRRQEFETAKYDARTLHEALERMGAKRTEFDTARYDAKTLHEALERMSTKRLESKTPEPEAPASTTKPQATRPQNASSDTVRYDEQTLDAMLEQVETKRR